MSFRDLTLYVIRHGECEHNVAGWAASHDDSPLTARGHEQARANGRLLKEVAGDLSALDFHLGPVAEIALVWPEGADARSLIAATFQGFRPNRLVAAATAGSAASVGLPLLTERPAVDGKPTAYVCRRYLCQLPVTEPAALATQLDAGV